MKKHTKLSHYTNLGIVNYSVQVDGTLYNFLIDRNGQQISHRKREKYDQKADRELLALAKG